MADDWITVDKLQHLGMCFFIVIFSTYWITVDKLQHLRMCFFIVILSTYIIRLFLSLSRLLYRWATHVGCILSLTIGAAKELGDEMGIWHFVGGSLKDGLVDAGCVLLAMALLHFSKPRGAQQVYDKALELKGPMEF